MNRISVPRVLGGWALLLPGVVAFQPVFGGLTGYLAAFVGITLGAAVAVAGHLLRWRVGFRVLGLVAAYLLVGGPLVLPETTLLGIFPSVETVRRLALLIFQGWSDILTVATPAGDISGPAAAPLLGGLVAGFAMATAAAATRAVQLPLLIPLSWLGLSVALGVRAAPTAVWLGAALGVGVLAWQAAHRFAGTRDANAAILLRRETGFTRRTVAALTAAAVIVGAAGAAVGFNVATGDRVNRQVLRDDAVPPLDLRTYASPLMKYRLYELTKKDKTLFEVRGMPEGSRLRLAVLESYDGTVFTVSDRENQYLRSGREVPAAPSGDPGRVEVLVVDYDEVWVPTFGQTRRIEFTGESGRREARGLYYNKASQQALTTTRLAPGSRLQIDAIPTVDLSEDAREALMTAGIGKAPLAETKRVPDALSRAASDWTAESISAYHQLTTIAERLRAEGYYSDGADGKSRSGHTAERLGTMFGAQQWIGDDEQYATAMALMATQLGIPTRVVLGFHPLSKDDKGGVPTSAPTDVWAVTGTQAHVWVEANLDGVGWVAFDPTPDRDQAPKTDAPQPKPKPKPQVDPPPEPPEKLPEDLIVPDGEAANVDEEDQRDWGWLLALLTWVGVGAGTAAVVSSPLFVILALKRRRARLRASQGDVSDQLAGAWDEVVDRARDIGHPASTTRTRREAGAGLQAAFPGIPVEPLAQEIDAAVFGAGLPPARKRDLAWEHVRVINKEMLATVPWYARPRAVFSARSLRRRQTEAALTKRASRRIRAPRTPLTPDATDGVVQPLTRSQP